MDGSIATSANFFTDFGGHSLLAVALVATHPRQPSASICRCARCSRRRPFAALAGRIDGGGARCRDGHCADPAPRTAPDTAPCSFAQRRLWFLDRLTPGESFHNIPVALRLRTPSIRSVLQRSLDVLVARHEVLRTTFEHDRWRAGAANRPRRARGPLTASICDRAAGDRRRGDRASGCARSPDALRARRRLLFRVAPAQSRPRRFACCSALCSSHHL